MSTEGPILPRPLVKLAMCLASLTLTLQSARSDCFPRGVIDANRNIGYSGREDRSIVAIDLRTGKAIWTSTEAHIPLALSENLLAAADYSQLKAGVYTIAVLSARTGALRVRTPPISFGQKDPDIENGGIPASVDVAVKSGQFLVQWVTSSRYRSGVPPPIQKANTEPKEMIHAVLVDPLTGRVTESPSKRLWTKASNASSENSVSYLRDESWMKGPWSAANDVADIEQTTGTGGARKIQLRVRYKSSRKLKRTVDLAESDGTIPRVTADGEYVLVPGTRDGRSVWRIVSVELGQQIGYATLGSSPQHICVADSKVFYVSSSSAGPSADSVLRAFDIQSGRELWEQSLGTRRKESPPPLPQ